MEQIEVKKEPVDNFDGTSTSADHKSMVYDESGVKKESEMSAGVEDNFDGGVMKFEAEDETFLDQGSKIKGNIKEEGRDSYFSEDDKNSSHNEGKEKFFECNLCVRKYQTRNGLFKHKKYIHRKDELEKFKCDKCDYVTVNKSAVKNHLKIHEKQNHIKCHFCEYKAAKLKSLHVHILNKHGSENEGENKTKITSKIHQCNKCSYFHVSKPHFKIHLNTCLKNVKQYECHLCQFKSVHKRYLTTHMKSHDKIKKLKCLFCRHQCNVKRDFDNHILRKHLDLLEKDNTSVITSKVHACQHCKYKTTIARFLKNHLNRNH